MKIEDIVQVLDDQNIIFWTEGNNVSENSVNIQCPFCADHSNHCGIFEDTLKFHCWRCNASGPFWFLLCRLTGMSELECKRLVSYPDSTLEVSVLDQIKTIIEGTADNSLQEEIELNDKEIAYPEFFDLITTDTDYRPLNKWCKHRKISKDTLIDYGCGICLVGNYANRLIIPIYDMEHGLVSFQGAALDRKAGVKYKTAPGRINDYLYGLNQVGNTIVLTEGILDAWRLRSPAVATFGTHITTNQFKLIKKHGVQNVIFCWDSDAYLKAKKIKETMFDPFFKNVYNIYLPVSQDPDSLGYVKTWSLIKEQIGDAFKLLG